MFYNTVHISEPELRKRKRDGYNQKHKIFEWFKERPNVKLTPYEVADHFQNMDRNSVRRCLTDLSKEGLLQNTKKDGSSEKKLERQGCVNYLWYFKSQLEIF